MSLLASETQNKISAVRNALQAVESHLEPLVSKSPKDVERKLAALEQAELQVGLAYTTVSLYFCHLLTQGVDPADHPIKQELERIQLYYKKLKATKETIDANEVARERKRLDAEVAQRMMQHYASAAEASMQRRQQGDTSVAPGGGDTETPAATDSSSSPTTEAPPQMPRPFLETGASEEADPVAASDALTAQSAGGIGTPAPQAGTSTKVTTPTPKKKRRIGGTKVTGSPESLASATAASRAATVAAQDSPQRPRELQAHLVPMDPAAGEEARLTAASLVARGKAAAERKKRKAESRASGVGAGTGAVPATSEAGTGATSPQDEPALA